MGNAKATLADKEFQTLEKIADQLGDIIRQRRYEVTTHALLLQAR